MSRFAGTWALTRFALRRDRLLIPVWIIVFVLSTVSTASATMALYPDTTSRTIAATGVNEVPVAVAFYGRIWDPTSLGALSLLKLGGFGGAMVAILAIMLVTRHTRAEEEKGRTELIGATVVGEWAWIAAALTVTTATMLAIGILSGVGLIAVGLPSTGSMAFGLAWATMGMSFAAIAAVTAQLASTGRAANALAIGILGVTFVLRAIGDVLGGAAGPTVWTWLSPIGWGMQVRPYAGDRLGLLVLPLAFFVVAGTTAVFLETRRDLGAGIVPDRAGRARAGRLLSRPLGLAWRLQRGLLIVWLIWYVIIGAVIGNIVNNLGALMDTPQAQQMIAALGGTDVMQDAFITLEFSIFAFVTASYGIVATRRLSTEEDSGLAEVLLATAVSRTRLLWSHLTIALAGTAVLSLTLGLAFGLASAQANGTTDRLWATVGASLVSLPAVWVMTGAVVAINGFTPRLTNLAWPFVVAFVLISEVGAMLKWPAWVMDLSPFAHIPALPAAPMRWTPLVVLTLISAALIAIGTVRFRQRDLDTA